jgi:hypothetical protein
VLNPAAIEMSVKPYGPVAGAAPLTVLRTQEEALRFTTLLMGLCLFFQRFGMPFGGESLNLVGPVGLCLSGWALARGTLVFDRARLVLYLGLAFLAVFGAGWRALSANSFDGSPSPNSMLQFLLLTGFAVLSFGVAVDEGAFFRRVNGLFAVVAVAGIAQFFLQFIGVRLFAFGDLLPERILYEAGYNLKIPVGIGDILKSNGFFLVEPSVLSQFMALALIIEVLNFRRLIYLCAFAGALVLSFSGTGWIVLGAFLVTAGLRLGRRGFVVALVAVLVLGAAAGLLWLAAPDFFAAFADRFNEISQPGTSGNMRFVTPFRLVGDVLARVPSALISGIGAGVSERISMPYAYDVNTPIKIMLEYGLPLLIVYVALFCVARRTVLQSALLAPCLVLVLLTGGYQQFGPVLYPVLLLVAVARLRPA